MVHTGSNVCDGVSLSHSDSCHACLPADQALALPGGWAIQDSIAPEVKASGESEPHPASQPLGMRVHGAGRHYHCSGDS